ncbi:MAG TPA: DAK2 domain-containing protein [Promineifilum sp.]|nr:DAK2 domain-containing protein [Promineifilum sp.]HRQ14435.1 DAK2 domain-containing protein [Promineifilum sp.]
MTAPVTAGGKWLHCTGPQLRKMARAGLVWLERNRDHVNSLNVFPVPDGDTGTNMLLTMRSAYARIEAGEETHVGKVAGQLAQGALMGARGNSGVILSQIWRGLAAGLSSVETFTTADLAQAFQMASDTAYKGVMRPVEGTILTVIREGAAEAADAARKSEDLRFMLERILERCQQALERTPDLLPILRQAGVVDSGGQGLVYILEGMMRYAQGELSLDEQAEARAATENISAQALAVPEGGSLEFPYDVQFILTGRNLNVSQVRARIDAMGDSTVVVGDSSTIKVHIHVKDPGEPLSYGISLGHVSDVVVENMQEQMEALVHGDPTAPVESVVTVMPDQVAVVAVAAGRGLINVFHSLGAAYVVNGGQTNNPSTEEIFQAIEKLSTDKVVILPNNKNIFLAAEAACDLSAKDVAVVHSRTIPQGIAALMALRPEREVETNAETMEQALKLVKTGEITRATRTVEIDGVDVKEGEIIALADGRLCSSGPDERAVLDELLEQLEVAEAGIVSLYFGADISVGQAAETADHIRALFPDVEVELVEGGQAHYHYILGVE